MAHKANQILRLCIWSSKVNVCGNTIYGWRKLGRVDLSWSEQASRQVEGHGCNLGQEGGRRYI